MAVVPVVDYLSNPRALRRVARAVRPEEIYDDRFCAFIRDLVDTMLAKDGAGLAATQIHPELAEPPAAFAMLDGRTPRVIINPRIRDGYASEWGQEACLSFRYVEARIRRPTRLEVEAVDDDWRPLDLEVTGFEARCVAHEIEHLEGRLMIDPMSGGERQRFLQKVGKAIKR